MIFGIQELGNFEIVLKGHELLAASWELDYPWARSLFNKVPNDAVSDTTSDAMKNQG